MTIAASQARTERFIPPAEEIGLSAPLGATVVEGGVNFSLFSRIATGVELLLFDREDDATPSRVIRLDPATNRSYHYWHVLIPRVEAGQIYGYRVDGPNDPARGLWFDASKVLLDPYGRGLVIPQGYDREAAARSTLRSVAHERQRASLDTLLREANRAWHGVKLNQPDWGDGSHSLALSAELRSDEMLMYIILNSYWKPLEFELPQLGEGQRWRRWIDTALDSPHDFVPWQESKPIPGQTYRAEDRSVVILSAAAVPIGPCVPRSGASPEA